MLPSQQFFFWEHFAILFLTCNGLKSQDVIARPNIYILQLIISRQSDSRKQIGDDGQTSNRTNEINQL